MPSISTLTSVDAVTLAEMQAIGIDKERILVIWNLQRDVVVDQLIPTEMRENPVTGGEPLPGFPLCFGTARLNV